MTLDDRELEVLSAVYHTAIVFDYRQQVVFCLHCRRQSGKRLHEDECPFLALGRVIERLELEQAQRPV